MSKSNEPQNQLGFDLRTRIAAAIMREQVMNEKDRKFLRLSFTDEAKLLADAVIAELGLRHESDNLHGDGTSLRHRYVTDWVAADAD